MFEENYTGGTEKSLEIFWTFWNQLGNFEIILKLVILVKIGIELNHTIVNFWNQGRIQWNIAFEDKWYVNWNYEMMFIPVVISQSTKLVGTIFYWV